MYERAPTENVELAVYADGTLELDMSLGQYEQLNLSTITTHGTSLGEFAENDPVAAYTLIRKMIGSVAANVETVSINDEVVSTRAKNGQSLASRIGRDAITSRMPEWYERPIELSVGVYPTEVDKLVLGKSIGERIPVLDISYQFPAK